MPPKDVYGFTGTVADTLQPSIPTAPEARANAEQPLESLLQGEITPEQWGLDQALARQAGKLDEVAGGIENSHTVGTGAKEADFDLYRGDPSRTLNGSGRLSSPDEWNMIISDIERAGGKVRLVEEDSIGYTPRVGESAGEITINKDASISALRHEMQHFYNDMEANWPGWKSLLDPEDRIANELKAYTKEIDLAKKMGQNDLAQRLWNNFLEEVETICNDYDYPNPYK